nr:PD-(D/E)XK nuclease family transposase [uncultured Mediterraneibacter sp.]
MKENPRKVSKSAIKSENALNEKEDFIMLPTVDFCFKELMQNENVRKGIIAAILNRRPDEIVNTELLPTILRKDSEDDECYRRISFCDVKTGKEYTDLMEMHILELPKLPPEQKSETDLMQWMRFLNGKRREDFEKMAKKNSCFEEAYKELDKLSADEKKRLEYEARQKAIRDRDILIKTGENRGRKEIILSMIEAGLPLEQIAEITKETLETIQELKKKMG